MLSVIELQTTYLISIKLFQPVFSSLVPKILDSLQRQREKMIFMFNQRELVQLIMIYPQDLTYSTCDRSFKGIIF